MNLEKRIERIEHMLADKAEGDTIRVVIINLSDQNGAHTEPTDAEIEARLEQWKKEHIVTGIPTLEWLSSEARFR